MKLEQFASKIYDWYLDAFKRAIFSSSYGNLKSWTKVTGGIDQLLMKSENEYLTMNDMKKLLLNAKRQFVIYATTKRMGVVNIEKKYRDKIDKLLHKAVEFETKRLELFLLRIPFGDRIDFEPILKNYDYFRLILESPIDEILEKYFYDKKIFKPAGQQGGSVYITETGKNYHIEDCPYCHNSIDLYEIKEGIAINYGLKPCCCLEKRKKRIEDNQKKDPNYMTAFIDESNRINPWTEEGRNGICSQGNYSYYICKGNHADERLIDDSFIVDKGVGTSDGEKGVAYITSEAIGYVLFKMKFKFGFDKKVKIYTDNKSVAKTWRQNKFNDECANLFDGVEVIFVTRDHNKIADELGRRMSVIDVPTSVYREIVHKCKKYDELYNLCKAAKEA